MIRIYVVRNSTALICFAGGRNTPFPVAFGYPSRFSTKISNQWKD